MDAAVSPDENGTQVSGQQQQQTQPQQQQRIEQRCVTILRQRNVQVVAFDMDQTAVAMHSRGQLRRKDLDNYLERAVPPFLQIVPALHAAGFGLAMATHSDEAEFSNVTNNSSSNSSTAIVAPDTHILGHELATALLQRYFTHEIVQAFCIVAYNPRVRGESESESNKVKRYHMRKLQEHFHCVKDSSQILFFDDTPSVVEDCRDHCGVQAILVNEATGFRWSDVLQMEMNKTP